MTRLAANTRTQLVQLQLHSLHRARRVAAKALLRFLACDRASQRVFERRRYRRTMSDREIETAQLFEITHTRLVKHVVMSKEKRLSDVALSEAVQNRFGNVVSAVGNTIEDGVALARDRVGVRAVAKRQLAFRGHDTAIRCDFQRLAHRRV